MSDFKEEEAFLGDISSNGDAESLSSSPLDNDSAPFQVEGDIQDIANEPPPFQDATTQIGDGVCVVCGAPTFRPPGLTPTGRKKRIPRHCDLHAPHVSISSERPRFSGVESQSQLQRVQDELADEIRLLGVITGQFAPVTGYYLVEEVADPFTIALLKLCQNNQAMLRIMHRAAKVAPIAVIAEKAAGVGYSMQVDQKRADPHSRIAHRLGVERAYIAVYESETPVNFQQSTNGFAPPPRYARAS